MIPPRRPVPTLAAQFWNNYIEFMKKGAKELGVNLIVLNADNKPDQMVKSLVQRCCGDDAPPADLRSKVLSRIRQVRGDLAVAGPAE